MAINENKLKELLYGLRSILGEMLNSSVAEMERAAEQIEEVFNDDV
jgi:hypothetical protein